MIADASSAAAGTGVPLISRFATASPEGKPGRAGGRGTGVDLSVSFADSSPFRGARPPRRDGGRGLTSQSASLTALLSGEPGRCGGTGDPSPAPSGHLPPREGIKGGLPQMRQAPDANSVRSAYSPATLPSCTRQTRLQAPRVELRWEIMTTVLSAKRKTVPVSPVRCGRRGDASCTRAAGGKTPPPYRPSPRSRRPSSRRCGRRWRRPRPGCGRYRAA